jgi:hypothetical protein
LRWFLCPDPPAIRELPEDTAVPHRSPDSAPANGVGGVASAVWLIVLLGLLVRLPVAFDREWVGYDEANYLMIGRNAAAGHGYVQSTLTTYAAKFHPLSFLVPAWLARLTGEELLASKLLFVALGSVAVLLIGRLGAALFSPSVGLVAAALVAVAPALTSQLVASISHTLFLPFFFGALSLLWRTVTRGRLAMALLAGFLIGGAWWSRADGLLVVPTLALFLLVSGGLLLGVRRGALACGAFVLGFSVPYVLYALFVEQISGGAAMQHSALYDFLQYPVACEATRPLASYSSLLELALAEPQCVVAKMIANAKVAPGILLAWSGFPALMLPLLGAAWVAEGSWDRRRIAAHLLLALSILPLLFYLPFYYNETRYAAPYAALAFVWCAQGLLAVGERLRHALPVVPVWSPAALAVVLLLTITVLHVPHFEGIVGVELGAAGRWLDGHVEPSSVLWTSQAEVAYFARRPWMYPPPLVEARHWRIGEGPVYLVVDDRHFAEKNGAWPQLVELAEGSGLTLVQTIGEQTPRVAIYRVDESVRVVAERLATMLAEESRERRAAPASG